MAMIIITLILIILLYYQTDNSYVLAVTLSAKDNENYKNVLAKYLKDQCIGMNIYIYIYIYTYIYIYIYINIYIYIYI